MATAPVPEMTRVYQTIFCDSTRWEGYRPRDGDIIVASSYKAGTTWTQAICGALIFQSPDPPAPLDDISPWLDSTFEPIDVVLGRLEEMRHRRYIKTHLPLTAIPYYDNVRYLVVARDGRDVWLSLWNHLGNMRPEFIEKLAKNPPQPGITLPPMAETLGEAFDEWISRAHFPWERDGYPVWSHHHHAQTWWDCRHLDNILITHFADMLDDLDGQMRRIAAFLDIPSGDANWPSLVRSVTFGEMKKHAEQRAPGGNRGHWKDNASFFHQGRNQRWREVLTDEQIERYESTIRELMEPGLVRWMLREEGSLDPKAL